MKHEGVDVSITGNSTNPTRFQHLVAGTYKKWAMENGKKYFSVASGGGTGRTLHPGQHGRRPRLLRPDRLHGPYAWRRPVRRLLLRARPRGDDGPDRHGQQPHGRRYRGLRRGGLRGLEEIRNRRAFLAVDPVLSSKASVKARTPCFFELFGGLAGPPHTKEISPDERGGFEHESGAVDDAAEMFQRPVQQTKSRFLA